MKKNKKIIYLIFILIIIVFFVFFMLIRHNNLNISIYNGENWNKKGKENEKVYDKKFKNISINNKLDKGQTIYLYTGKRWVEQSKRINTDIYGIKVLNSRFFLDNYTICYRTYNSKDKWLNWTCSDDFDIVSGNKKEKITGIQIKIIDLDTNKYDYLEDLYENKNKKNYNF